MAAVGGIRWIKACKFLPEFGWQPTVLTVREGFNYAYDPSMLDQLNGDLKVYRARDIAPLLWWDRRGQNSDEAAPAPPTEPVAGSGDISSTNGHSLASRAKTYMRTMLSLPDIHNFWIPTAVMAGLKAIRREKIDLILPSSPPASSDIVGYILSVLTGKPLVPDIRDLWTQNEGYHLRNLPRLYKAFDRFLEKRILVRSKILLASNDSFAKQLASNPNADPAKVHYFTNGLDPDDFKDVAFPTEKNNKFLILHVGSLYGSRDPRFFFKAVLEWVKQRPEVADQTEIRFVGNAPGYENIVKGTPLEKMIRFVKHMPQKQVLSMLWEANLLLLILGFDPAGAAVVQAKLYEYIAAGREILALIPDGVAAERINRYERGTPVTSEDIPATLAVLNSQFDRWKEASGAPESKLDLPEEFDRRLQNKKLAGILDLVV